MGKEREILILSKSKKHHNYCVAGIDCNNLSLVRLISDDSEIHYAIKAEDLVDIEGQEAQVLDKITVTLKKNDIKLNYQPENILLDTSEYIINNGSNKNNRNLSRILDFFSNKYEYIFYNTNNKISSDEINNLKIEDKHSLEIIGPTFITIRIKDDEKRTLRASIKYNEQWYNELSITDIDFEQRYFEEVQNSFDGYITLRGVYLLISLGEKYNGNHYKLIASIIE
ncbi:MAG: hypothetical protein IJH34_01720 [Romboutsia sp.]|nr:hypothetical protein [Romboutsia sp.]